MKKILFILFLCAYVSATAQSLQHYADQPLTSMFDLHFKPADWRSPIGRPSVFLNAEGREERFFAYGAAFSGVDLKWKSIEEGPYSGMDDMVNFMMLHDSEYAADYFIISQGKGMLLWAYITGLTSHEENLDTKVFFHVWVWLPAFPDTTDAVIFYLEDFRSGGTAEVFSLIPGKDIQISETYGRVMISCYLAYDPQFGSEVKERPQLYLSGAFELQSFE